MITTATRNRRQSFKPCATLEVWCMVLPGGNWLQNTPDDNSAQAIDTEIRRLKRRTMNWISHWHHNKEIMLRRNVLRKTRTYFFLSCAPLEEVRHFLFLTYKILTLAPE